MDNWPARMCYHQQPSSQQNKRSGAVRGLGSFFWDPVFWIQSSGIGHLGPVIWDWFPGTSFLGLFFLGPLFWDQFFRTSFLGPAAVFDFLSINKLRHPVKLLVLIYQHFILEQSVQKRIDQILKTKLLTGV